MSGVSGAWSIAWWNIKLELLFCRSWISKLEIFSIFGYPNTLFFRYMWAVGLHTKHSVLWQSESFILMNVIWVGCQTKCYSISSLIFAHGRSLDFAFYRKLSQLDPWSQDLTQALSWGWHFLQSRRGEESSGGYISRWCVHDLPFLQISSHTQRCTSRYLPILLLFASNGTTFSCNQGT